MERIFIVLCVRESTCVFISENNVIFLVLESNLRLLFPVSLINLTEEVLYDPVTAVKP